MARPFFEQPFVCASVFPGRRGGASCSPTCEVRAMMPMVEGRAGQGSGPLWGRDPETVSGLY